MSINDDQIWTIIANSMCKHSQDSGDSLIPSFNSTIPTSPKPEQPKATLSSRIDGAKERFEKRLKRLNSLLPIGSGRVIPSEDSLAIGGAKRCDLAILFIDICGFSKIPSGNNAQQDKVLKMLALFISEMLEIVRTHGGTFEKNTGDGIMAYFKESTKEASALKAVEAAVTMHCLNDQVITPGLKRNGLPEIHFRVGIEVGPVLLANIGIPGGEHRSVVAIGTAANVACKLMNLIKDGGIVIGNRTRDLLPSAWQKETTEIGTLQGFILQGTEALNPPKQYPGWELKYRAPSSSFASFLCGLL